VGQDVISLLGGAAHRQQLGIEHFAPPVAVAKVVTEPQRGVPAIARDRGLCDEVESALAGIPTTHTLMQGLDPEKSNARVHSGNSRHSR
jgi:hypothetical protein